MQTKNVCLHGWSSFFQELAGSRLGTGDVDPRFAYALLRCSKPAIHLPPAFWGKRNKPGFIVRRPLAARVWSPILTSLPRFTLFRAPSLRLMLVVVDHLQSNRQPGDLLGSTSVSSNHFFGDRPSLLSLYRAYLVPPRPLSLLAKLSFPAPLLTKLGGWVALFLSFYRSTSISPVGNRFIFAFLTLSVGSAALLALCCQIRGKVYLPNPGALFVWP